MKPVEFKNAYYIKLGKKGKWEETSIQEGKLRIGWKETSLGDINNGDWQKIKQELEQQYKNKGAATRDYKALRYVVESISDDVWITFYASHLWWCRAGKAQILEDEISKYRKILGKWSNCDINNNRLLINQIPGCLAKFQGFRGTVCRVKETDDLRHLINDSPSDSYLSIVKVKTSLASEIEHGLRLLHWKDFETLVDLLFREAGWRRISLLGEAMKYADLELEEPVTGDLYQVQVKSRATLSEFKEYADVFSTMGFRKLYFVVHTPIGDWSDYPKLENVELILPDRLAQMVIEFGLIDWLLKKIK